MDQTPQIPQIPLETNEKKKRNIIQVELTDELQQRLDDICAFRGDKSIYVRMALQYLFKQIDNGNIQKRALAANLETLSDPITDAKNAVKKG